jgi:hypothetical protein
MFSINIFETLDWTPLPVDVYPSEFIISVEDTKAALRSTKPTPLLVPTKCRRGFFVRTRPLCVAH